MLDRCKGNTKFANMLIVCELYFMAILSLTSRGTLKSASRTDKSEIELTGV